MKRNDVIMKCSVAVVIIAACFLSKGSIAQSNDRKGDSAIDYRNAFKLNLTSILLLDHSLQFGYERVLNKKQSLHLTAGYSEFPMNLNVNLDNTTLGGSKSKSGFVLGAEYRFYLAKENKHAIPHGVYLAPFVNFYSFRNNRFLQHNNAGSIQSGTLDTRLNWISVGGEMGYQFVLGKRWVIDGVLFGPALTRYHLNAKIGGDLTGINENETIKAVIDALKEKLPLLDKLAKEGEVNSSGTESFWAAGFRYNISVGFRF
jgi:Protein of unknown function (DUF3575)